MSERMRITSNGLILTGKALEIYNNGTEREREILMVGIEHGIALAKFDKELGERMNVAAALKETGNV